MRRLVRAQSEPRLLPVHHQQPIGAVHLLPVIFIRSSTNETDLIVLSLVTESWPRKLMGTKLSNKSLQERHVCPSLSYEPDFVACAVLKVASGFIGLPSGRTFKLRECIVSAGYGAADRPLHLHLLPPPPRFSPRLFRFANRPKARAGVAADTGNVDTTTMTLKNAALLALIGSVLMTALLVWDFIFNLLNLLRGLVPAVTLFSSLIYAFGCFSVMVFFFVFHRAQS